MVARTLEDQQVDGRITKTAKGQEKQRTDVYAVKEELGGPGTRSEDYD